MGLSSQFVVMTTGAEPVAAAPETSVKVTVAGVAEIVNDSAKVAVSATLAELEFS